MLNYIKATISKLITIIYGLLLLKILSISLNKNEFTDYFIYYNLILYLSTLMFGMQGAIILRYYHNLGKAKTYLMYDSLNKIIISIIFLCCLIVNFFVDSHNILLVFFLTLFYGLFLNKINFLRIKHDFSKVVLIIFYQAFISLILLYIFNEELTYQKSLIFLMISFIVSVIITQEEYSPKLIFRNINIKFLIDNKLSLKYAFPIVLIGMFNFMLSSMDQFFLLNYGYKDELASYIANYNIAEKSVVVLLSIITLVFIPTIFKKYKTLEKNTFIDVFKVSFYYLFISTVIVVVLYFISSDLTTILTSSKFVEQSWIIPYIAFGSIFLGLNSIISEILTIQYKTIILLYCYLFGFMINFIFNFLVIEKYGIEGAIFTTIISYVLMNIFTLIFVYREYQLMNIRNKNVLY